MPRLYSSKHIIKVLQYHNFEFVTQKGSHKKFRRADKIVIVPDPKKEIPMGTFHSILRQSGLKKANFDE